MNLEAFPPEVFSAVWTSYRGSSSLVSKFFFGFLLLNPFVGIKLVEQLFVLLLEVFLQDVLVDVFLVADGASSCFILRNLRRLFFNDLITFKQRWIVEGEISVAVVNDLAFNLDRILVLDAAEHFEEIVARLNFDKFVVDAFAVHVLLKIFLLRGQLLLECREVLQLAVAFLTNDVGERIRQLQLEKKILLTKILCQYF